MDALGSYLAGEIIKALGEGNLTKFAAYFAIFALLWWQLRGLRKELKTLNTNVAKGFTEGEHRFSEIEKKQMEFEHRLTLIEPKPIT